MPVPLRAGHCHPTSASPGQSLDSCKCDTERTHRVYGAHLCPDFLLVIVGDPLLRCRLLCLRPFVHCSLKSFCCLASESVLDFARPGCSPCFPFSVSLQLIHENVFFIMRHTCPALVKAPSGPNPQVFGAEGSHVEGRVFYRRPPLHSSHFPCSCFCEGLTWQSLCVQ